MSQEATVDAATLRYSLAGLRGTVFLVMLMWTIDKFLNPDHTAAVYGAFYGLQGLGAAVLYTIGALQALLIIAFLLGIAKRWSTLAVLLMHTASTLTPMARYFDPWSNPNLLFFAAWPMLAALVALYLLREHDTWLQWNSSAYKGLS